MEPRRGFGIAFSSVGETVTDSSNRFLRKARSVEKPRLLYFNAKGRAELARLLLAVVSVDYEDVRFTTDEWQAKKPEMPSGTLPVYEVPGKGTLSQSGAIARYLARENNLAGQDNFEKAQVEMILGCVDDIFSEVVSFFIEKDQARKVEKQKEFEEVTLPSWMTRLNKLAGPKHFVSNTVTVADISLFDLVDRLGTDTCKLSEYPKLKAICDNVRKIPAIERWLTKRPVTPF